MRAMDDLALPDLFRRLAALGSLDRLLAIARDEDIGAAGDVTTRSIIDPRTPGHARLVAREAGVVSGLAATDAIARSFEIALSIDADVEDGGACAAGQTIARVDASLSDILLVERTLLNLVGRMSGIATTTRRYVDLVQGTNARICATRKTTPGLRHLEKYAVRCGGGWLHRIGLYDAVLYKDNHVATVPEGGLADALAPAIRAVRAKASPAFVEVEVDTIPQLRDVLRLEDGLVDTVLLDNMTTPEVRDAVAIRDEIAPAVLLEASGGVNEATVREIAETGVERISVGALTHSAVSLDLGLDVTGDEHGVRSSASRAAGRTR